jgi:hypothetical protein
MSHYNYIIWDDNQINPMYYLGHEMQLTERGMVRFGEVGIDRRIIL